MNSGAFALAYTAERDAPVVTFEGATSFTFKQGNQANTNIYLLFPVAFKRGQTRFTSPDGRSTDPQSNPTNDGISSNE